MSISVNLCQPYGRDHIQPCTDSQLDDVTWFAFGDRFNKGYLGLTVEVKFDYDHIYTVKPSL